MSKITHSPSRGVQYLLIHAAERQPLDGYSRLPLPITVRKILQAAKKWAKKYQKKVFSIILHTEHSKGRNVSQRKPNSEAV
jgi:hypothetical protein